VEEQIQVPEGSVWWGWNYSGAFAFQVTEEETGRKFSVDYQVPGYYKSAPNGRFTPNGILTAPWTIAAPGLINVELYSTSISIQTVQLVLMFAEPVACGLGRSISPCSL
jgi:hypothetical protein